MGAGLRVMRFIVLDEEGQAIRKFWSLAEAKAFVLEGWTIRTLPRPAKAPPPDLVALYGEAPF